jgi:hypothetical protein
MAAQPQRPVLVQRFVAPAADVAQQLRAGVRADDEVVAFRQARRLAVVAVRRDARDVGLAGAAAADVADGGGREGRRCRRRACRCSRARARRRRRGTRPTPSRRGRGRRCGRRRACRRGRARRAPGVRRTRSRAARARPTTGRRRWRRRRWRGARIAIHFRPAYRASGQRSQSGVELPCMPLQAGRIVVAARSRGVPCRVTGRRGPEPCIVLIRPHRADVAALGSRRTPP